MKTAFRYHLAAAILAVASTAFAADARVARNNGVSTANLESWIIDPQLYYAGSIVGGNVNIDFANWEVSLTLYQRSNCSERPCPHYLPGPIFIKLPILSVSRDGCGSEIIVGLNDKRPVDGAFEMIEVRDNARNFCEMQMPATSVEYTYEESGMGGNPIKAHSVFTAEKLSKFDPTHE